MERKGIGSSNTYIPPSSSNFIVNQPLNGGTIISLEQMRNIEWEMRELEKRKIKEEIMAELEMSRQRELRKEAIRELMLEGKIPITNSDELIQNLLTPIQRPENLPTLPFKNYFVGPVATPLLHPHQPNQTEAVNSRELPFQREPKATTMATPKPFFNLCKGEPIRSVKPLSTVPPPAAAAGTKRKLDSVIENSEEPTLCTKAKKKPVKEWNCDLCKVKVMCEDQLQAHLKGKRHRTKVRSLKGAQRGHAVNMLVETPVAKEKVLGQEPPQEVGHTVNMIVEMPVGAKEVIGSGKESPINAGVSQEVGPGVGVLVEIPVVEEAVPLDQEPPSNEEIGKEVGPTNVELVEIPALAAERFWCMMCDFGAASKEEIIAHKRGNDHLRVFMKNGGFHTDIVPM